MLKAVFLDYTGTIIKEGGKDMEEVVMRICKNSDLHEPKEVIAFLWNLIKNYEKKSYGDAYITEDEIVDRALQDCVEKINLKENLEELHTLIQKFWIYAPAFEDAKEFFKRCTLPIYVITNNGVQYVEKGMIHKGLKPAGIISADMAGAYKPHKELFEKALEVSGYEKNQVIHIGDSVSSDVEGARAAGICPVLLNRKGDVKRNDVQVIHSLTEIL